MRLRLPLRRPAALALAAALAASAAGCGSGGDDWSDPRPAPSAIGTLQPGFVDPSAPPSPEATITPRPGSWDDVHPSAGYRVALLRAGNDAPTETLAAAVRDWADAEEASLRTITLSDGDDPAAGAERAMAMKPDLIICIGHDLIDPLVTVTAHYLDQQFLVIGAELAEPTGNVTAADWAGASFRGEGLGMSSGYDPASFTPERAGRAVRAGVAAVLTGWRGIVVWID